MFYRNIFNYLALAFLILTIFFNYFVNAHKKSGRMGEYADYYFFKVLFYPFLFYVECFNILFSNLLNKNYSLWQSIEKYILIFLLKLKIMHDYYNLNFSM